MNADSEQRAPASLREWTELVRSAPTRIIVEELIQRGVLPAPFLTGAPAPVDHRARERPDRALHSLEVRPSRAQIVWRGVLYTVTARMADVLWRMMDAYPDALTVEQLGEQVFPEMHPERRAKNVRQQVTLIHRAVPGLVQSAYKTGRVFGGGYWLNLKPGDDMAPANRPNHFRVDRGLHDVGA